MAIRTIVLDGDPVLRKKARKVSSVTGRIRTLAEDMLETMYDADGVGLAAPQVGVLRQIVVIDVGDGPVVLINPEILSSEGVQRHQEGCLSVPETSGYVDRPQKVVVRAMDLGGDVRTIAAQDYFAIAVCHELDHLEGVLFTDKILALTDEELDELRKRDEEDEESGEGEDEQS